MLPAQIILDVRRLCLVVVGQQIIAIFQHLALVIEEILLNKG